VTAALDAASPLLPAGPPAPGLGVVIERELLRAGRRWQTWVWRAAAAAVLLVLVGTFWQDRVVDAGSFGQSNLAWVGQQLFEAFSLGLFLLISVLTPVMVGQAVIEERNAGTLTLLALTRLTPRQVLMGKLLSRLVLLEAVIVAGLPAMAVSLSLGGVGPGMLLSTFVQCNVAILGLGAVSVFVSLYARTPLLPAVAAWAWAFVAWVVATLPVMLGGGDDDYAVATSPLAALIEGDGTWMCVGPLLLVLPVALATLTLSARAFGLALAEEDGSAEQLHSGFWDLDRMLSNAALGLVVTILGVLPLGIVLALVHESRALPEDVGALAAWVWTLSALVFGTVLYLFLVRGAVRWVATKRVSRKASRAALIEIARDEPRTTRARSLSGRQPTRARALIHRPVWGNPVAWREVRTAAYGGLIPWLGRAWIAALLLLAMFLAWSGIGSDPQGALAVSLMLIGAGWVLTVIAACASVAAELQRNTLSLLLSTGMAPARIVRGKLAGVLAVGGPPLAAGLVFAIVGVASFDPGLRWSWTSVTPAEGNELAWRWVSLAACALAAQAFLATSTLWVGLKAGTPSRAWLAGLGHALAWAIVPAVLRVVFDGWPAVEAVLALLNPVFDRRFDYDIGPTAASFGSAVLWFGVAVAVLLRLPRALRRRAAL